MLEKKSLRMKTWINNKLEITNKNKKRKKVPRFDK